MPLRSPTDSLPAHGRAAAGGSTSTPPANSTQCGRGVSLFEETGHARGIFSASVPLLLAGATRTLGLPSGGTFCVFGWNARFLSYFRPSPPVGAFSLDPTAFLGTSLSRNWRRFPVHGHNTRRPRPKPPSPERAALPSGSRTACVHVPRCPISRGFRNMALERAPDTDFLPTTSCRGRFPWNHWSSRPCPTRQPTSFLLTRLPHRKLRLAADVA